MKAPRSKESYNPERELDSKAEGFGHGCPDFYCVYHFEEKIKGNPNADIIDVYEALDMFLPGMFAFRSILDGGASKDIPNLRNKEDHFSVYRHLLMFVLYFKWQKVGFK